jgi:uncharacterized protein DUF3830
MKKVVQIIIEKEPFEARFQHEQAPETCAQFECLLPWKQRLIHARWSGEACWIPLGGLNMNVGLENATSYPRPGEVIFYPGGLSETEVLIAYGTVRFGSKVGQLAGNPFLIITEKLDQLAAIGRSILWSGAKEIVFR